MALAFSILGNWLAAAASAVSVLALFGLPALVRWSKHQGSTDARTVFLSMQMSDLAGNEYVDVRQAIMDVVFELRRFHAVYFFNEFVQRQETFDERLFDARTYLREIDKAEYFVAVLSRKIVSSIYFEAGYALARGKRCIYFVADDRLMPMLMRRVALSHSNVRVCRTTDLADIKEVLKLIGWQESAMPLETA
jgi:hypothetical protein